MTQMNDEPQPDILPSQSTMDILTSKAFRFRLRNMNALLEKHMHHEDRLSELSDQFELEVDDELESMRMSRRALVSGNVYHTNEFSVPSGGPVPLSSIELEYDQPLVTNINGIPRLMLSFCQSTGEDGEVDIVYVDPLDIERIDVQDVSEDEVTLESMLIIFAKQSQQLISSETFLALSLNDQRKALYDFESEVDKAMRRFFGDDVWDISCLTFMSEYPEMYVKLKDTFVDQSGLTKKQTFTPKGVYRNASFAELRDRHGLNVELHLSKADFSLADGVPCLVFEDGSTNTTFLIPIDTITDYDGEEDV